MVALESRDVLERGDAAPAFELPGADGETYALADFEDETALLVVFTCNHCPYAKAKFDELNRLASEYDDVSVVGINSNDDDSYPEDDFATMQELVAEGTIAFDAYLRDESQSVAPAYGAMCTPDPFLFVNTEHRTAALPDTVDVKEPDTPFRLVYHGRVDDALDPDAEPTDREMSAHIDAVLAGETVTDEFRPSRGCSIKWKPGNEPEYWD